MQRKLRAARQRHSSIFSISRFPPPWSGRRGRGGGAPAEQPPRRPEARVADPGGHAGGDGDHGGHRSEEPRPLHHRRELRGLPGDCDRDGVVPGETCHERKDGVEARGLFLEQLRAGEPFGGAGRGAGPLLHERQHRHDDVLLVPQEAALPVGLADALLEACLDLAERDARLLREPLGPKYKSVLQKAGGSYESERRNTGVGGPLQQRPLVTVRVGERRDTSSNIETDAKPQDPVQNHRSNMSEKPCHVPDVEVFIRRPVDLEQW
eukprot:CAMPEP_0177591106 /NCGR_PEP_ID=MMETSP0419_2-20121207/7804_1 /TAXON_ID=582737 /ORGANISM="Tetraselmis sp., Strain GSL018" /LENGTH=264 /DNA_ID=CAMNT_0019081793 /DNA_START=163 /DNA_END=954 /DNA_ORIENTATION=+